MTRLDFDPDLERLGEALRASATIDLAREERAGRPAGAERGRHADAVLATRPRRTRPRPRVLAGSTLGLAGVGAALVLALGGSAAPPAFAITKQDDGSVLVKLNINSSLPQVNQKLAAMGTKEQISIQMAQGAATVPGPVTCTPGRDQSNLSTTVKVLDGPNGTEVISPGQTGDNTGVGTWHLAACSVYSMSTTHGDPLYGEGNTGSGNSGNG
jgi:hypothetical protein